MTGKDDEISDAALQKFCDEITYMLMCAGWSEQEVSDFIQDRFDLVVQAYNFKRRPTEIAAALLDVATHHIKKH